MIMYYFKFRIYLGKTVGRLRWIKYLQKNPRQLPRIKTNNHENSIINENMLQI
jgi:hypothetical protein